MLQQNHKSLYGRDMEVCENSQTPNDNWQKAYRIRYKIKHKNTQKKRKTTQPIKILRCLFPLYEKLWQYY